MRRRKELGRSFQYLAVKINLDTSLSNPELDGIESNCEEVVRSKRCMSEHNCIPKKPELLFIVAFELRNDGSRTLPTGIP